MALSVGLQLGFQWTNTKTAGLSTAKDSKNYTFSDALAAGIGLDEADQIFTDSRTLNATSETLDVAGVLKDAFGDLVTFARLKGLLVVNKATAVGAVLTVGGAPTNAVPIETMTIGPGGARLVWEPSLAAVTVGVNDKLLIDAGAQTISYDVIIVGASA